MAEGADRRGRPRDRQRDGHASSPGRDGRRGGRRRRSGAPQAALRTPRHRGRRPDAARHRRLADHRGPAGRGHHASRSSTSARAPPSTTRCTRSGSAATTTWPSRSACASWWPACRRRCGAPGGQPEDAGRPRIEAPGLVIDPDLHQAILDGEDAALTRTEFRLLYVLAVRAGPGAQPRPAAAAGVGDALPPPRPHRRRVRAQAARRSSTGDRQRTPTSRRTTASATGSSRSKEPGAHGS